MWPRSPITIILITTAVSNYVTIASPDLLSAPELSNNYNVYVRAIPSNLQQRKVIQPPQQYQPPLLVQFSEPQQPQVQIQAPPQPQKYQPPLIPLPQSQPQPLPPSQTPNQQVIYVGGQQGVYSQIGIPSPSQQGSPTSKGTERKVVGQPPQQLIQKAPASEIQFDKATVAKEKDSKPSDDEYVIYYYYYYDNDTNNNNLSLNFDDIPNLESYDHQKNVTKESVSQRLNAARHFAPVTVSSSVSTAQSVHVVGQPLVNSILSDTTSSPKGATAISVSVSVSEGTQVKPVPNIYRYGSNDVPRVPVTPNLVDPLEEPEDVSDGTNATLNVTTVASSAELQTPLATDVIITTPAASDSVDNQQEDGNDVEEETQSEEDVSTQEETTTTEITTTTEPATTTTEKSGRLGGLGKRKRFGGNSITPGRRPVTTTTTLATTDGVLGRRPAFRPSPSNRFRRPGGVSRSRPTPSSPGRKFKDNILSDTTTSSSTATKNRFGGATTKRISTRPGLTKTTSSRGAAPQSRTRPTVKPVNVLTNRQRARPSFFRSRNKKTDETESTTTTSSETDETVPPTTSSRNTEEESEATETIKETEEDIIAEETEVTEKPQATTTAIPDSRFSGLFRSRPRPNLLGNRPRPNLLTRPRT